MIKLYNENTAKYCSFRAGKNAAVVCFPENIGELREAVAAEGRKIVLGNGSNTLFVSDFDGTVIVTTLMKDISADGNKITALCGAQLTKLARVALDSSLSGLEFAYGIPGTVGGGVYMNAGAYGGSLSDVLSSVVWVSADNADGIVQTDASVLSLYSSYRHSMFTDNGGTVVSAEFTLKKGERNIIEALMNENMAKRTDKQPLEYPSAGSTFKRPAGHFAGALIENAGLKGLSVGGAAVSEKHAGFIINRGGATPEDILALINEVKKRVFAASGVMLECEVQIIG